MITESNIQILVVYQHVSLALQQVFVIQVITIFGFSEERLPPVLGTSNTGNIARILLPTMNTQAQHFVPGMLI
ncbi:hypothetical protein ASV05_15035 [Enterobacter hormaechei subsp. xiangfangensis]|nr:hypothetical protein ASV05_15035 [Enterobacter hormaechei subsp. xiangfangensis]KTJ89420.1 hypothetical protein ASU73_03815 [Enterobacter hormaechei subsp. xiangfangensis]